MTGLKKTVYKPNRAASALYEQLYDLYRTLHDAFGTQEWAGNLHPIMKRLLAIRTAASA